MIGRRCFVFALSASALVAPFALLAQRKRQTARIGLLIPEALSVEASRVEALRAGLRDHGYVEGENIAIELWSAEGNYDRLPKLSADLASLNVDVIVAFGTKAVSAAQRATTTIPIVAPVMGDPVGAGFSSSLARPGGNVTGSVQFSVEGGAKRLEFLKEAAPHHASCSTHQSGQRGESASGPGHTQCGERTEPEATSARGKQRPRARANVCSNGERTN